MFTEMAVGAIQYFSGGVPRLINSICDLCMVYAFADGVKEVGESLVFRVIADRQLSGIAPFAHTTSVDDPAVREKISAIAGATPEVKPEASPAEPPEKTLTAERDLKIASPGPVRPAAAKLATIAPERVEPFLERPMAAPEAIVSPSLSTESVRPITRKRRSTVVSGAEPKDHPVDEYYFDGEEQELLLTVEADNSDDEVLTARSAERSAVLNGAHGPRVVPLHAEPGDRLSVAGNRVSAKSETERQFPVIESNRAGAMAGGDSLRVEETLLQAAPGGTAKPSERSWWRRAFRRGR
jgi:hypothetical protein